MFGGEEALRAIERPGRQHGDRPRLGRHLPAHPLRGAGADRVRGRDRRGRRPGAGRPVDFDDDGSWIDYRGQPRRIPTYSFSRSCAARSSPAAFDDKIVVVGAAAPTLQDVHPTSISGGLMPGAEIQANAVATVLDAVPAAFLLAARLESRSIALLAFLGPARRAAVAPAGRRWPSRSPPPASYLVVAQLAFNAGLVLPVVYPLVALLIGAVGTLGMHYLVAAFERQRVRDTFSRFVPATVVEQSARGGRGCGSAGCAASARCCSATSAGSPPTPRPPSPTRSSRCSTTTSAR